MTEKVKGISINTNVDAVIFSKEDLTLNGTGTLTITTPGGHGVVSKDSLKITGGTYAIDADAHGLCGKDEVSIHYYGAGRGDLPGVCPLCPQRNPNAG